MHRRTAENAEYKLQVEQCGHRADLTVMVPIQSRIYRL